MANYQVQALPANASSVPSGAVGFDTNTKLDATHVKEFASAGYQFVVRYLSLGTNQDTVNDLDYYEADSILEGGLGLMAVQHVRYSGWTPTATLGTTDGTNARNNAYYIGLPSGMNIWLDLEGVASGTAIQDIIDYCNAWYDAVSSWGYVPGIYVGANSYLTADQLYYDLKFSHYWKSLSTVPTPSVRGYQLVQSAGQPYYNVSIDRDSANTDNSGGNAFWLHK